MLLEQSNLIGLRQPMGKWSAIMKWGLVSGLTVVAAGLGWLSWLNWAAGEQVSQAREEIEKAGYPIHLKDLYKANVADNDNAYLEFAKWKAEIKAADIAVSGDGQNQPPFLAEKKLTEEDVTELTAIMAAHQVMIEELIEAAEKKQLRIPLDVDNTSDVLSEILDRSQEFRSIARVLSANVRLKIAQGKREEAMDNAIAILKWSKLITQQPTLVSYLVATAVRGIGIHYAAEVLYAGELEEESLKKLETVLHSFDSNTLWKNVVFSEIPFFVDVFHPTLPVATRHLWFSLSGEADYLFTMKSIAEKQILQDGLFVDSMPGKDDELGKSWLFASIMPAMNATQEATMRVEVQSRCLLTLLQWRRQGGNVQEIKELQLPALVTKDPYDGGTLKFQASDLGPVIYSVGRNRVDDGGGKALLSNQEDIGLMSMEMQGELAGDEEE